MYYIIGLFALFLLARMFVHVFLYYKSAYFKITNNSYLKMRRDKGRYGEYLTYGQLKFLEKDGAKFLFNLYIPKADETTEIDVLMIYGSGVYVIENKNYSGWIFGGEKLRTWTQTLPQGKGRAAHKEHFLNPVFQNNLHIKYLRKLLEKDCAMHSIIVFSNRCVFKKLELDKSIVIHRRDLKGIVQSIDKAVASSLSNKDIADLFAKLRPYSNVDEKLRQQHIANIINK